MGECGRGLLAYQMLYIKVKTSKWPKHAILTGMIRLSIVVKLTGLMGHAMWMTVARLLQGGCPLLVARCIARARRWIWRWLFSTVLIKALLDEGGVA